MSKSENQTVHFWSNDYRFCGSPQTFREFSFNDDEVTCPHCLRNASAKMAVLAERLLDHTKEAAL